MKLQVNGFTLDVAVNTTGDKVSIAIRNVYDTVVKIDGTRFSNGPVALLGALIEKCEVSDIGTQNIALKLEHNEVLDNIFTKISVMCCDELDAVVRSAFGELFEKYPNEAEDLANALLDIASRADE